MAQFEIQTDAGDELVEVVKNNIRLFDTTGDQPNVKYTTYNAFPLTRTGKWGTKVKVESQVLAGNFLPTVGTRHLTNANMLKPVKLEKEIEHFEMFHEIEIDKHMVEDGAIDRMTAINDAQFMMQQAVLSVFLKGSAIDNKTGKSLFFNRNSLVNIATSITNNINFGNATALDISKTIDNLLDLTSNAGGQADTIVMSKQAYRKMTLAGGTSLESEKVMSYIQLNGITIYPTELLDSVGSNGAIMIAYKNDASILKGFIGNESTLINEYKTNYTEIPTISASIAGFVKVNDNANSVVMLPKLLG